MQYTLCSQPYVAGRADDALESRNARLWKFIGIYGIP